MRPGLLAAGWIHRSPDHVAAEDGTEKAKHKAGGPQTLLAQHCLFHFK